MGEVAVQFTLGELPPEEKPAEQKPEGKSATAPAGEAEPPKEGGKPQPQTKPNEPTLKERLDNFFDQLAPQSKALTGKEFRLEKGAGLLFISSEKLSAFYRAQQKTWGGLGEILTLVGINANVTSVDVLQLAALSLVLDMPALTDQDRLEFDLIIGKLEEDGGGRGLSSELQGAFQEWSQEFPNRRSVPTDVDQLLERFGGKRSEDLNAFIEQHSALTQLLLQSLLIYSETGSAINQRITTYIRGLRALYMSRRFGKERTEFYRYIDDRAHSNQVGTADIKQDLAKEKTDELIRRWRKRKAERAALGNLFPSDNNPMGAADVASAAPLKKSGYIMLGITAFIFTIELAIQKLEEELRLRNVDVNEL